ncbi:MAG: glycosyltransferase, partial [Acidobacteriota bacterium]
QFPFITARRSVRSRRLAEQGAQRQQSLLASYRDMARAFASRLSYDTLHVVVQQNLLPFLWKDGCLGGRTFDVLMTALPMAELQSTLDHAASLHPESTTLGDFRADQVLVSAESDALSKARRIITPHTFIASLFPQQAEPIKWKLPDKREIGERPLNGKARVVFPASTVGRKGCYELREALRNSDAKLILLGPIIESEGFWDGFDVERGGENWIQNADLVVLPAFVEHRPRRLLAAAAAGIPVIASAACGVKNVAGIETIASGDPTALRIALDKHLSPLE